MQWSHDEQELYDSLWEGHPTAFEDAHAEVLFQEAFLSDKTGLEFEYAVDEFELYMWYEYQIQLDSDFWDDWRDWYDAQ